MQEYSHRYNEYWADMPVTPQEAEVMWEQFGFLMDHERLGTCPPGCIDCWRRDRMKEVLMIPFQVKQCPMAKSKGAS